MPDSLARHPAHDRGGSLRRITENVSSAIEPEDRHRVRAIAAAILEHQGFQASELLDLVIDEKTAHLN
ncbi:hypothetical protein, partial [Pseudomonas aeruginosa]|uniref:hypothetical protein n=1 Tax=Pseudomonas aeruginosa TaxID=287 RepID=UPI001968ECE4